MIFRTISSLSFCIRLLANAALLVVELAGALSWLIVIDYRLELLVPGLLEVIICGGVASMIDIDHFLEAKSLHLKDALQLSRRPIFHSTSLLVALWIALIFVAIWTGSTTFMRFSWIFLTAGLSHHLRDGIRRGLWLYPFGSTSPLPYWIYITATALLPHLIRLCLSYAQTSDVISKYQHVYEV